MALTAINAATYATQTGTALTIHATGLGITLTDYNELGATYKIAVNTTVLGGKTYVTVVAIKTAFDNAVATQKAQEAVDTAPRITSVATTTADGSYKAGTVIPITITFSSAVNVMGSPLLTLGNLGNTGVVYAGKIDANTLLFNYTVQANQNTSNLDVTALTLDAGVTILGATNNPAVLTLPNSLADTKAIVIDTTPVTVGGEHVFSGSLIAVSVGATSTWTATDVASATYTFNGDAATTITSGTKLQTIGSYVLTIIDYAGNVTTINFTITP